MRWRLLTTICALAGWLCGCAGYKLGPTNGSIAGQKSIQIQTFQNQALEPRLSEAAAIALRKLLQQDGTYRLATRGEGDILVRGVILRFDRMPLTFQPKDLLTARDFNLFLTAKVTAIERISGKVLLDREIAGRTTVRLGADQTSTERQALPLLAEDWAKNATALLVEGTWE